MGNIWSGEFGGPPTDPKTLACERGMRFELLGLGAFGRKFDLAICWRDAANGGGCDGALPLIVFCHGFGASCSDYDWVSMDLVPEGYVVAMPSLLKGHKISIDLDTWADSIIQAIDYATSPGNDGDRRRFYRIDPDRVGVAGHSMGGAAAIVAASRDRRVKAVVSISPPYFGRIWGGEVIEAAKSIAAPTMIMVGSEDRLTPPKAANAIYEALRAQKQLSTIAGANHLTFTDYGSAKRDAGSKRMAAWFGLNLRGLGHPD